MGEIEISAELRARSTDDADRLFDLGATLFTIGISELNYDLTAVRNWLAWRDSKNGT